MVEGGTLLSRVWPRCVVTGGISRALTVQETNSKKVLDQDEFESEEEKDSAL